MRADPPVSRVLMTADGVGGVWPYTLDLSSALVARGLSATVAVMGPALRADQMADAAHRGIRVVQGGQALEWMDDPWDDVDRAGAWLLEIADDVRPDVVHLNGYCHGTLPWPAPAVVVGHSCVRSWWRAVHGTEPPPAWDRYATAVKRGLQAARLVAAPTAAMLGQLVDDYGPFARTCVIPNGCAGVEMARDEPPPKDDLILSAGRVWDAAKNVETVCAVAPSLGWPVYVAGSLDGPGGGGRAVEAVRYLGVLPRAALAEWFARAAIYALPARYEPFGLSVLEAAAAGCALVLGDIRSLRENWSDAAVFVPSDNRRALAAALSNLMEDPDRRAALGRAALMRARQFTVDRMADGYLRAYATAAERTVGT